MTIDQSTSYDDRPSSQNLSQLLPRHSYTGVSGPSGYQIIVTTIDGLTGTVEALRGETGPTGATGYS
jgi:hypothetical protein